MGSNEKKALRARMQKTGESHQAAVRQVRAARERTRSGGPEQLATPPRRTKEEAIALVKGGLGGEVYKLSASYIEPIFWLTGPVGTGLIRNGTTFFVDAGKGTFGVTAGHVFDGFRDYFDGKDGFCEVGMRGIKFDLRERLIARGRNVDIATYRIEKAELDRLGTTIVREPSWPPARPKEDRGVFYAGYPAQERKLIEPRKIEWGVYGASGMSTAVNDQSIVCQMERENALQVLGLPIPHEGYDVGGMSGAPMFASVESTIVYWRLVGVIYEGSGVLLEHVRAAHADRIRADGTIID